jgi:hypothetical protein
MGNVSENRLRRMAERQGLELRKSRRRDVNATEYGGYWLVDRSDPERIVAPVGPARDVGFSLGEVESFLTDPMRRKIRDGK